MKKKRTIRTWAVVLATTGVLIGLAGPIPAAAGCDNGSGLIIGSAGLAVAADAAILRSITLGRPIGRAWPILGMTVWSVAAAGGMLWMREAKAPADRHTAAALAATSAASVALCSFGLVRSLGSRTLVIAPAVRAGEGTTFAGVSIRLFGSVRAPSSRASWGTHGS